SESRKRWRRWGCRVGFAPLVAMHLATACQERLRAAPGGVLQSRALRSLSARRVASAAPGCLAGTDVSRRGLLDVDVPELDRRSRIGWDEIKAEIPGTVRVLERDADPRPPALDLAIAIRSFYRRHDLLHVVARIAVHWPCSCREPFSGSFDQAGRAALPGMTGCIPGGFPL